MNGAGYYIMGVPIDPTTGNRVGSVPTLLKFDNDFLPAQQTTQVTYRLNLAKTPKIEDYDPAVPGSDLMNPARFSANPLNGAPTAAQILGRGATLTPDASALVNASADLAALASAGGSLVINGTTISVAAGSSASAVIAAINAQSPRLA